MKIGLLGAGRIGAMHAALLREHTAVTDVLVCDPIAERAAAVADIAGGRVVQNAEETINGCDALIIATSTDSHERFLSLSVAAGRPTLCEKPLTADLVSSDRVMRMVCDSDVPVQMGFNRRFDVGFRRARTMVEDGTLGQLLLITGQHHDHEPPPPEYVPVSGGQHADQMIHDFDLVRYVSGREVVAVHAAGTAAGMAMFADHDDTAVSVITLWLDDDSLATLVGVRMDPVGYDVRMELFGTRDSIAVGMDDHTPIRSVEDGGHSPQAPYTEWLSRFGPSYAAQLDAFVAVARREQPSPCTVVDARAAFAITDACRRSRAAGMPVPLEATR